jgi:hypothetical protein
MAFQTAAGASLAVTLSQPATYDEAGYTAVGMVYTVVGEVTNIGEFGQEYAVVTHNPLASRGTKKAKGSYNNGTLNPTVALDPDDAGQGLMEDLLATDDPGTFRVTLQDGTAYYMEGVVTTFRPSVGEVDSVVTATTTIELTDKAVVKVAAP